MFGKQKKIVEELNDKIAALTRQLEELQTQHEQKLRVLRQQLASTLRGIPPTSSSVMAGLAYSELPKEEVADFIKNVPSLLILDVRTDEGWNNGHIPEAKHVPAQEVFARLNELADRNRPILTVCANGNTAVSVAQLLVKEGFTAVFNALGGMAGYVGELVRPELKPSDIREVQGVDRELVARVLEVLDREVRPGLKRDGGDLQVLAVEEGVVKLKLVGACTGCGALKRTVNDGIKNLLKKKIPEIQEVEDHTLGKPVEVQSLKSKVQSQNS